MNEHEREDAHRVGTVIRAARKLRGLSQVELSRTLQISQVTLSSIENGQTAISGSIWYRLSEALRLLPDHTFFEGIVDSCDISNLNNPLETGFSIPKKYANNAFSTVRTSQPFFNYFEECYGRKGLEDFLRDHMKVDPDIRHVFNLSLSIRFNCDIAAYLIRDGKLKPSGLNRLTDNLLNPKTHGILARDYVGARDPLALIRTLIQNVALYERNFHYSIVNESAGSLEISSVPADFMRYFSYREDELPDFVNRYRQSFLESFSRYLGGQKTPQVKIIPSATKRKTECLFKIVV